MAKNAVYRTDLAEIKTKFHQIAVELDAITKDSYRDAEVLERLQKTLNIDYITHLITTLETLEKHAQNADEEAQRATQKMIECQTELENEGTRLEKLWDAYKKQEKEINNQIEAQKNLQEQLQRFQKKQQELDKATTELHSLKKDRERMEWLESELEKYEREKNTITESLMEKEKTHQQLKSEIEELRQYIPYKEKTKKMEKRIKELEPLEGYKKYKKQSDELENLYAKEQERLAKLYKIYEDTTIGLRDTKKELKQWQTWYKENSEYIKMARQAVKQLQNPEAALH